MKIVVTDKYGKSPSSTARLEALAKFVLEEEGRDMELGIALIGGESMRALNIEYMGRDEDTDVLAFDYGAGEEGVDGEIIISVEKAEEEARCRGISPEEELHRYIIHGVLHLCGFRDGTDKERRQMREREEALLGRFPNHLPGKEHLFES